MSQKNKDYIIDYIPEENRVVLQGTLRLQTVDRYNEILDFILKYVYDKEEVVILDLSRLVSLNSSGIAALGILLIKIKEANKKFRIFSSKYVHWQSISIEDFREINSDIAIEYVVHH